MEPVLFAAAGVRANSLARRLRRIARTAASFRLQTRKCITQLILYHGLDLEQQIAVHVRAEHLRMHIAFSANGRGVTQPRGDSFDRGSRHPTWSTESSFALCLSGIALPR